MTKPVVVFDIEIYKNYLLIALLNLNSRRVLTFEQYEGQDFDRDRLLRIMKSVRLVSFNGNNFDVPIISAALRGDSVATLKGYADSIIVDNVKHWQLDIPELRLDHIDLIEIAPGQASLKLYGGRLHCRRMQDLPIEPDQLITPEQREELRTYCVNDLETTEALYNALLPQLELREKMSEQYGQNLMSKSDAQIAEAVIKKEVTAASGNVPKRPNLNRSYTFKYRDPGFIKFETTQLQELYDRILATEFGLNDKGSVAMPDWFDTAAITIGDSTYKLGIGGLHSTESERAIIRADGMVLRDSDVTGYYPAMMLHQSLYPTSTGPVFVNVFGSIVKRRSEAKREHSMISKIIDELERKLEELDG